MSEAVAGESGTKLSGILLVVFLTNLSFAGIVLLIQPATAKSYACQGSTYSTGTGSEYLVNGGFENDFSGWLRANNQPTISTGIFHSGTKSAQVDGVSSMSSIAYQYVDPPDTYVFSHWFYVEQWGPGDRFQIDLVANWNPSTGASDQETTVWVDGGAAHWAVWVPNGGGGGVQKDISIILSVKSWHLFEILADRDIGLQCLFMDSSFLASASVSPSLTFASTVAHFGDVSWFGDAGIAYYDDFSIMSAQRLLPDLVVAAPDIGLTPSPPLNVGDVVTVNATVHNVGSSNASTFIFVIFADLNRDSQLEPGEDIATWTVPSLPMLWDFRAETLWTASREGINSLCAIADPLNDVEELSESNNLGCVDVEVIGLPDYLPVNAQPTGTAVAGLSLPLQLSLEVFNRDGFMPTTQTTLAFFDESTPSSPFFTAQVPPIPTNGLQGPFTAAWISPGNPGTYRVVADVDYNNDVTESNETDNLYMWTIYVVRGPITALLIGQPRYDSTSTYIKSSTPLDFYRIDRSGIGIRNTSYRLDGGAWKNYSVTGRFTLFEDGGHVVEWYSIDYAGNVENVSSQALWVDDGPPETGILPSTGPFHPKTLFNLTATDAGSGVCRTEYRIGGGEWIRFVDPFQVPLGDHTVEYRSIDNIGNVEVPKSLEVETHTDTTSVEVETNYKPIVAVIFTTVLLLVGFWSSLRKPWKGVAGKKAVLQAFAALSLPFIVAESLTGILSLATGILSIPPVVGIGAAVDLTILIVGLLTSVINAVGKQRVPPPSQSSC